MFIKMEITEVGEFKLLKEVFEVGDIIIINDETFKFDHNGINFSSTGEINELGYLDGFQNISEDNWYLKVRKIHKTKYRVFKVLDTMDWSGIKTGMLLIVDTRTREIINTQATYGGRYITSCSLDSENRLSGFGDCDDSFVKVKEVL